MSSTTVRRPPASRLGEVIQLIEMLVNPDKNRPQAIYNLLSTHNNLAETSHYLNLGYWRDASTYDQACEALGLLVARTAAMGPGDEVLDAGFGFGDQHLSWLRELGPRRICGINVTEAQVAFARERLAERGLSERVDVQLASATEIPFGPTSFDKVVSVEAAFHFNPRERFFSEAFRVLRPGGRLALCDIVPSTTALKMPGWKRWLYDYAGRSFWQYPAENMYGAETYAQRLAGAGFVDVAVTDIGAEVFEPFKRYARARVRAPEVRKRVNPLVRAILSGPSAPSGTSGPLAYILVSARKPEHPGPSDALRM